MGYIDDNAAARERLLGLVRGLSEDQLRKPIDDDWTIGAVLGHLAFWDRVHIGRLRHAVNLGQLAPVPMPEGLTDAINDGTLPTWRAVEGQAAISLFEAASADADAYVRDLDAVVVEGIRAAGYPRLIERHRHRNEHAAMIEGALGR